MEHWVDLLLPISILVGLAVGFGTGFGSQFRSLVGFLGGTILAIWLSNALEKVTDRFTGTSELQVAHGFVFFVMLCASIGIITAVASSIMKSIAPQSSSQLLLPGSRLLGALLGICNGIIFATLVVMVVHLVVSGSTGQSNRIGRSLLTGTQVEGSVSAQVIYRAEGLLYRGLERALPQQGTPEPFRFIVTAQ